MKTARVFVDGIYAGNLEEIAKGKEYRFIYREDYKGISVSFTMPVSERIYTFDHFPPFFEGLLPEGATLQALLRKRKLDSDDYFEQLMVVGKEMVGNVTVEKI